MTTAERVFCGFCGKRLPSLDGGADHVQQHIDDGDRWMTGKQSRELSAFRHLMDRLGVEEPIG